MSSCSFSRCASSSAATSCRAARASRSCASRHSAADSHIVSWSACHNPWRYGGAETSVGCILRISLQFPLLRNMILVRRLVLSDRTLLFTILPSEWCTALAIGKRSLRPDPFAKLCARDFRAVSLGPLGQRLGLCCMCRGDCHRPGRQLHVATWCVPCLGHGFVLAPIFTFARPMRSHYPWEHHRCRWFEVSLPFAVRLGRHRLYDPPLLLPLRRHRKDSLEPGSKARVQLWLTRTLRTL